MAIQKYYGFLSVNKELKVIDMGIIILHWLNMVDIALVKYFTCGPFTLSISRKLTFSVQTPMKAHMLKKILHVVKSVLLKISYRSSATSFFSRGTVSVMIN